MLRARLGSAARRAAFLTACLAHNPEEPREEVARMTVSVLRPHLAPEFDPSLDEAPPIMAISAWTVWRHHLEAEVGIVTWRQYAAAVLRFLAYGGLAEARIDAIGREHVYECYADHVPT